MSSAMLRAASKVLSKPELRLLQAGMKLGSVAPEGTFRPKRNTKTGNWNKPKFSLRQQAVMRKAAMVAPLGVPASVRRDQAGGEQAALRPIPIPLPPLSTERKPLRTKLPKLPKDQRLKAQRQEDIREKVAAMGKTLDAWRAAKKAERSKLISKLPF